MIPTIIAVALVLYTVAILFVFPMREVTQPPARLQILWEVLLPGTSPAWHYFGGLALVAWTYFVLQDVFIVRYGSPYFIMLIATPSLSSAYGISTADQLHEVYRLVNPSGTWVYLAPAVLFAVNLFLVLRARRRMP